MALDLSAANILARNNGPKKVYENFRVIFACFVPLKSSSCHQKVEKCCFCLKQAQNAGSRLV